MENLEGKVIIVGNPSVGKTTIVERWCGGTFESGYKTTIGADFKTFKSDVDGDLVTIKLWDVSGSDRFKALGSMFYRNCEIIIIVYDVSNPETFTNIKLWLEQAHSHINNEPKFWLVGNKCDLDAKIDEKFLEVYCQETGFQKSYLVSAKTYKGLDVLLDDIGKQVKIASIERNKIMEQVRTVSLNNKIENSSKCSC